MRSGLAPVSYVTPQSRWLSSPPWSTYVTSSYSLYSDSYSLSPALRTRSLSSSPNPPLSAPTPVRLGLFSEYQLQQSPGLTPCTPGTWRTPILAVSVLWHSGTILYQTSPATSRDDSIPNFSNYFYGRFYTKLLQQLLGTILYRTSPATSRPNPASTAFRRLGQCSASLHLIQDIVVYYIHICSLDS